MSVTVSIADDLAEDLKPYKDQFSEILALGIREFRARHELGFHGVNSVLEKLAALPAPEEVMALRPSPDLQERLDALLEKNRSTGLSSAEEREWDRYQYVGTPGSFGQGKRRAKNQGCKGRMSKTYVRAALRRFVCERSLESCATLFLRIGLLAFDLVLLGKSHRHFELRWDELGFGPRVK